MRAKGIKPILLSADQLNVLVIGYGKIGQRKARAYRASGAKVIAVDPHTLPSISTSTLDVQPQSLEDGVLYYQMTFESFFVLHENLFNLQHLVLICTNQPDVNQIVQEKCVQMAKLYNRTDYFEQSLFSDMLSLEDQHTLVAISGKGHSPYIIKYLRPLVQNLIAQKNIQKRLEILNRVTPKLKFLGIPYEQIMHLDDDALERIGDE